MDEALNNRNDFYCRRQEHCVALVNTTNNYSYNDDWARIKMRLPRAMSTIVEENLSTQLRDVNQNVLELLDAAGRRISRCESTHSLLDSSTATESSATNSDVSIATAASNPSATSHDIESLTYCSSRKSRSFHFTSKQSSVEIKGDHPRIGRQKRRLKRLTVVSNVLTKKSMSYSDIYNQHFSVYPVHVKMPKLRHGKPVTPSPSISQRRRDIKHHQPSILPGNMRRSASQKNQNKLNEQQVLENPPPPQNDTNKRRKHLVSKYAEMYKDCKRDAANDRDHHRKINDSKAKHRERHRDQKSRNFSSGSSVGDKDQKAPKKKPPKTCIEKKHFEYKNKEKRAKSPRKGHAQIKLSKNDETQMSDEKIHPKGSERSTSPSRCNRERSPKVSTKAKEKEKYIKVTRRHMDRGDSKIRGRAHETEAFITKKSKEAGLTNYNEKSKKREENDKEDLEKCNERKKAKGEGLVRIKQSILQLACLGKLGDRKQSKSKHSNAILDKSSSRSPSRDKVLIFKPKPQNLQVYTVSVKVSSTSNMQRFLEQDNANLNKLCSCEGITPENKAKPTITRVELGSLEIPAFKHKEKKRDTRRRHRKHHENDDDDERVRVDTGTMPHNEIHKDKINDPNRTKTNFAEQDVNLKFSSGCKRLHSNSSLCENPTFGSLISSYDSHETVNICDNISITSLGDVSNLMIVSELTSSEDRSIPIIEKDDVSNQLPFSEPQHAKHKATKSILESLYTSPIFDSNPTSFIEPYCYMTVNTTLNKQKIRNTCTNTDQVMSNEGVPIDYYSDVIQRAKPYQSKSRRTIFKRPHNKLVSGNRPRRRLQQECTNVTLLSNLLDNAERHCPKSKIPVFFNDKRILLPKHVHNYSSDASSFVDDKSDKKASRIPRPKLNRTLENISELNPQNDSINQSNKWDGRDLAIDSDSTSLKELSKSKNLMNLEEEIIDIYWDDTDSIPNLKLGEIANLSEAERKRWFNNILNKEKLVDSSASNVILNNAKDQDLKETRGVGKSLTMAKKWKEHAQKSSDQDIERGSNHDLPQKDSSDTKTSADSSAETNTGYNAMFIHKEQSRFNLKSATTLPTDVSALAKVASKDTQPSSTTRFIVNLADLEDTHKNAMLEDSWRRIGSKINMENAIRKVGSREKHSVSLQVIVPSKHADTNTSWSNLPKYSPGKKPHHWKSKLPLRINRSKQTLKTSYTFPVEIDLAQIGLLENSRSDVSCKSRFWETGKRTYQVANNVSVYGQGLNYDCSCSNKFDKHVNTGKKSSKLGSKILSLRWWRNVFSKKNNRRPVDKNLKLNLSAFEVVLDIAPTCTCELGNTNMLRRSSSLVLPSTSKSEDVSPLLRSLSLGSVDSSRHSTDNIWASGRALIVQVIDEDKIHIRGNELLNEEELIAVTDYEQRGSRFKVTPAESVQKSKEKLPVYKTKKRDCKWVCHKKPKRPRPTQATKVIFDVPPPPVHADDEFDATRHLVHTAQQDYPLGVNHEAREEAQRRLHEYEERIIEREKLAVLKEDKRETEKQMKQLNQEAEHYRDGYEDIYTPITRCDYGMTYYNFKSALRNFILQTDTLRILTPCVKGHMQKAPMEIPPEEVKPVLVHVGSQTCKEDINTLVGEYIFPDFEASYIDETNGEENTEMNSKTKGIFDLHAQNKFFFEIHPEFGVSDLGLESESEPVSIEAVPARPIKIDASSICDELCSCRNEFSPEGSEEEYTITVALQSNVQEIHVVFKDIEYKIVIADGSFIEFCDCGGDVDINTIKRRYLQRLCKILRSNSQFLRNIRVVLILSIKDLLFSDVYSELAREFIKDIMGAILRYKDICYFDAVQIKALESKYRHLQFYDFDICPRDDKLSTIAEESESVSKDLKTLDNALNNKQKEIIEDEGVEETEPLIQYDEKIIDDETTETKQEEVNVPEPEPEIGIIQLEKTSFANILSLHNSNSCTCIEKLSKATSLYSTKSLKSSKSCVCIKDDKSPRRTRKRKLEVFENIDMAAGDDGLDKLACLCRRPFHYKLQTHKRDKKKSKHDYPAMELKRFYTTKELIPAPVVRYFYSCSHVTVRHPPILWVLAKKLVTRKKPDKCTGKVCKERHSRGHKMPEHRTSSRHSNMSHHSEARSCSQDSLESKSSCCSNKKKKPCRFQTPKRRKSKTCVSTCASRSSRCRKRKRSPHRVTRAHDDSLELEHCRAGNSEECNPGKRAEKKTSACCYGSNKQCCKKKKSPSKTMTCADVASGSVQCRVEFPEAQHGLMPHSSSQKSTVSTVSTCDPFCQKQGVQVNREATPTNAPRRHSEPAISGWQSVFSTKVKLPTPCSSTASSVFDEPELQEFGCGPSHPCIAETSSVKEDEKPCTEKPKPNYKVSDDEVKDPKFENNCIKENTMKNNASNNKQMSNIHPSTTASAAATPITGAFGKVIQKSGSLCVKSCSPEKNVLTTEAIGACNASSHSATKSNPVEQLAADEDSNSIVYIFSTEPATQSNTGKLSGGLLDSQDVNHLSQCHATYAVTTQTPINQTQPMISMTVLTDETIMMDQESATSSYNNNEIQTLLSLLPTKTKRASWLNKMTFYKVKPITPGNSFCSFQNLSQGAAQTSITLLPTLNFPQALFAYKRQHTRTKHKKTCECKKANETKIKELLPAQNMESSAESLLVHIDTAISLSHTLVVSEETVHANVSTTEDNNTDIDNDDSIIHKITNHPPMYVKIKPELAKVLEAEKLREEKPVKHNTGNVLRLKAHAFGSIDSKIMTDSIQEEASKVINVTTSLSGSQDCSATIDNCCQSDNSESSEKLSHREQQVSPAKHANADSVRLMTVEELSESTKDTICSVTKLDKLYLCAQYVQTDFDKNGNNSMANYLPDASRNSKDISIRSSVPTVNRIKSAHHSTQPIQPDILPTAKVAGKSYTDTLKEVGTHPKSRILIQRSQNANTQGDKSIETSKEETVSATGVKTSKNSKATANAGVTMYEERTIETEPPNSAKVTKKITIVNDLSSGTRDEDVEKIMTESETHAINRSSKVVRVDNDSVEEHHLRKQTFHKPIVSKVLNSIGGLLHYKNKGNATCEAQGCRPNITHVETMTHDVDDDPYPYSESEATDPQIAKKSNLKRGSTYDDQSAQVTLIKQDTKYIQFPRSSKISQLKYYEKNVQCETVPKTTSLSEEANTFYPYSASQVIPTDQTGNDDDVLSSGTKRKLSDDESVPTIISKKKKDDEVTYCNPGKTTSSNLCRTSKVLNLGDFGSITSHSKIVTKDSEAFVSNSLLPKHDSSCQKTSTVDKQVSVRSHPEVMVSRSPTNTESSKLQNQPNDLNANTSGEKSSGVPAKKLHCDTKCKKRKCKRMVFNDCCDENVKKSYKNQSVKEFEETHPSCCMPRKECKPNCGICERPHNNKRSKNNTSSTSVKNYGWKGCCTKSRKPPKYIFNECCDADTINDFYKLGPTKFTKLYPECCWPRMVSHSFDEVVTTYHDMIDFGSQAHVKNEDSKNTQPKTNIKKRLEYIFNDCCDGKTLEAFHKLGLEQYKKLYPQCCWPETIETDVVQKEESQEKLHQEEERARCCMTSKKSTDNSELVTKYEYILKDCCGEEEKALLAKLGFEKFATFYPQCCIPEKVAKLEARRSSISRTQCDGCMNTKTTCKKCCAKCSRKKSTSTNLLTEDQAGITPEEKKAPSRYHFGECCDEVIKNEFFTQGEKEFKKIHGECCWPIPREPECCDRDPGHWRILTQQCKDHPELLNTLPTCCHEHVKRLIAQSDNKSGLNQPAGSSRNAGTTDTTAATVPPSTPPPSRASVNKISCSNEYFSEKIHYQSTKVSQVATRSSHMTTNHSVNMVIPTIVLEKKDIDFPLVSSPTKLRQNSSLNQSDPVRSSRTHSKNKMVLKDRDSAKMLCECKRKQTTSGEIIHNKTKFLCECKTSMIGYKKEQICMDNVCMDNHGKCTGKRDEAEHLSISPSEAHKESITFTAVNMNRLKDINEIDSKCSLLEQIDTCFGPPRSPRSISEPNLLLFDDKELLLNEHSKLPKGILKLKKFLQFPKLGKPKDIIKNDGPIKQSILKQESHNMVKTNNQQVMSIHSQIQVREDDDQYGRELEDRYKSIDDDAPNKRQKSATPQDERNIKFLEEIELIGIKRHKKHKKSSDKPEAVANPEPEAISDPVTNEPEAEILSTQSIQEEEEVSQLEEVDIFTNRSVSPVPSPISPSPPLSSSIPDLTLIMPTPPHSPIRRVSVSPHPPSPPPPLSPQPSPPLKRESIPPLLPEVMMEKLKPLRESSYQRSVSEIELEPVGTCSSNTSHKKYKPLLEWMVSKFFDMDKPHKKKRKPRNKIIRKIFGELKDNDILPKSHIAGTTFSCGCSVAKGKLCKCDGQTRYACHCKQKHKERSHVVEYSFVDNSNFYAQNKQLGFNLRQTSYRSIFELNQQDDGCDYSMDDRYSNIFNAFPTEDKYAIDSNWRPGGRLIKDCSSPSCGNSQDRLSTIVEGTEHELEYEVETTTSDTDDAVKKDVNEIIDIYKRLHQGSSYKCMNLHQNLGNRLPHILIKSEFNPKLQVYPTTVKLPTSNHCLKLERKSSKLTRLIKKVKCSISKLKTLRSRPTEGPIVDCAGNSNCVFKKDIIRYTQTTKPIAKKPQAIEHGRKEEIRIGATSYLIRAPRSKGDNLNSQRTIDSDIPSLRSYETPNYVGPHYVDVANNVDLGMTNSKFDALQEQMNQNHLDQMLKLQQEITWINEKIAGKYRDSALRLLLDASLQVKKQLQDTLCKQVELSSTATLTKPDISEKAVEVVRISSLEEMKLKQTQKDNETALNVDNCKNCFSIQSSCCVKVDNKRKLPESSHDELMEFRESIRRERERIRKEDLIRRKQAVSEVFRSSRQSTPEGEHESTTSADTCALFGGHTCRHCTLSDTPTKDSSSNQLLLKPSKSTHLLAENLSSGGEIFLSKMTRKADILSTYVPGAPPVHPVVVTNCKNDEVLFRSDKYKAHASSSNVTDVPSTPKLQRVRDKNLWKKALQKLRAAGAENQHARKHQFSEESSQPSGASNKIIIPFNSILGSDMLVPGTSKSSEQKRTFVQQVPNVLPALKHNQHHNKIRFRLQFESSHPIQPGYKRPYQSYILEKLSNTSYSPNDKEYILNVHDYNTQILQARQCASSSHRKIIMCTNKELSGYFDKPRVLTSTAPSEYDSETTPESRSYNDDCEVESHSGYDLRIPCSGSSHHELYTVTNICHHKDITHKYRK